MRADGPAGEGALFVRGVVVGTLEALIDRSIEENRMGADRSRELEREVESILSDTRDSFSEARRARDEVAARSPGTECRRALVVTTADWAASARWAEARDAEEQRTMIDHDTVNDEWLDELNQAVIDTTAIAESVEWDPAEALRLLRASTALQGWSTHAESVARLEALVRLCADEFSDGSAPAPEGPNRSRSKATRCRPSP